MDAELAPARGAHPALDRLAGALPLRVDAMTTEAEARRQADQDLLAARTAVTEAKAALRATRRGKVEP